MATIRPGRCYSKVKGPAYTRVSKRRPRKSYAKGVPVSKIHQFEMGQKGDYEVKMNLIVSKPVQIRSNALESARVSMTKHLTKTIGDRKFFLKIRVYPHQILRENKMATGAGADRFSAGMRASFGRPIGQAARVKEGQIIATAEGPKGKEKEMKVALKRGAAKMPCRCFIR